MKMNSRKVMGFLIGCIIILIIWTTSLIFYKEILNTIGITIVLSIPGLLTVLIGGNSYDKKTISKDYRKELDDKDK